jgi:hypothetical protein
MIKIASAHGFTTEEIQRLQSAVSLANQVMTKDSFKDAVLVAEFTNTQDAPPVVLAKLTLKDYPVQFSIETPPWYKRWFSKEVAREVEGVGVIFDRNKYAGEDIPELANTVAHECCHVAGYSHPFYESADRDGSVPYSVGAIVEKLAREVHPWQQSREAVRA